MFKIGTAQRMMLPYSAHNWRGEDVPRLSESYVMKRTKNPMQLLGLKNHQAVTAYITKVLKALTKEGFETTREEIKNWFEQGYIIVEWANPPKEEADVGVKAAG